MDVSAEKRSMYGGFSSSIKTGTTKINCILFSSVLGQTLQVTTHCHKLTVKNQVCHPGQKLNLSTQIISKWNWALCSSVVVSSWTNTCVNKQLNEVRRSWRINTALPFSDWRKQDACKNNFISEIIWGKQRFRSPLSNIPAELHHGNWIQQWNNSRGRKPAEITASEF